MTRGLTVCLLLVVAAAAPAQDEVPLDKLTPAQVQARLEKVMGAPAARARLDDLLKAIPVEAKLVLDAKAVEFQDAGGKTATVFAPGRTKLVWRYKSATPLDAAQAKRVTELMQQVLAEAMNQERDPTTGKTLVTTDDWMALSRDVTITRLAPVVPPDTTPLPPAGNTAPTITLITDKQVVGGDVARVRFTLGDGQTPAADLQVTSVSSDPDVLPPAHQTITPVSPDGAVRELALVTTQWKPGTVRLTVTVTDGDGLTGVRRFLLVIHPFSGTGSGGGAVSAAGPVTPAWHGGGPWYGTGYVPSWSAPYPAVVVGRGYCGCR